MGYMAGDYYAGDYYAGGILSGIGSIFKGAVKTGLGFLTGGPGGAARALIGHAVSESHDNAAPAGPSNLPVRVASPSETSLQGFVRRGGRLTTGGRAVAVAQKNAALQPAMIHPALMAGFRHRRTMRWTNPKALARAERRIHSAVKHMTKYIRWVHPTKAGHAAPKFGRKKKSR